MPKNTQSRNGSGNRQQWGKKEKKYFSITPPKKDRQAIKAMLAGNPQRVLDFLSGTEKSESLSSWYDGDNGTHCVSYSLGSAPGSDIDRRIMGRASNLLNAIAIIVYWLDTLSIEYMFPEEEEDDEDTL